MILYALKRLLCSLRGHRWFAQDADNSGTMLDGRSHQPYAIGDAFTYCVDCDAGYYPGVGVW